MNTQKIFVFILGLLTVLLTLAAFIYAQVVWKQYLDMATLPEESEVTTNDSNGGTSRPLTPEENIEILDSLATSSGDIITLEEQEAILNSLSTTSSSDSTQE